MSKRKYTRPIGLVDADMLIYLAGFATQRTHVSAVWYDYSDTPHHEVFSGKTAMKEWQLEHPEQLLVDIEEYVFAEPLEHTLAIVKNKMEEIEKRDRHLEVYIKGEGNFRDSVATLYPYKGNRTAAKPLAHDEIRRYLKERWGAKEVHGKEADDQIAMRARQIGYDKVLVCHADKDLDQIPGKHYNYQKNVYYEISQDEAILFFYQQVLSGDPADNIKGCWKLGTGGALRILHEVYDEWLDSFLPDEDLDYEMLEGMLWERVLYQYELSMGINGCPYAGMPVDAVALENARLVWMQDESGRLWTPPDTDPIYMELGLDD